MNTVVEKVLKPIHSSFDLELNTLEVVFGVRALVRQLLYIARVWIRVSKGYNPNRYNQSDPWKIH